MGHGHGEGKVLHPPPCSPTGRFSQEVLARGILPQAKGVYPKLQLHGVKPTTTSALGGPGYKQQLTRSMTG